MSQKSLVWLGMFVGSSLGSLIPFFWGADLFSFSSVLLGAIGGLFGIWLAFKIS
jgi:hypothetical protein